ncbi:MAG: hypothetical protein HY897_08885 [Deltaproteobacteria bacterium]|nr:hypothetical protein [Deltaproteobacteria bacterium]
MRKRVAISDRRSVACDFRSPASRLAPRASHLRFSLLTLLCAAAAACGPSVKVKPISLSDPALSQNARRFLADSEDAVAMTRAWRDAAAAELSRARGREAQLGRSAGSFSGDARALEALEAFSKLGRANSALAGSRLMLAGAELALARQKFSQVTAEIATQHDMAIYDLETIRRRTDEARKAFDEARRAVERERRTVEDLNTAWLKAYAAYVKSGGNPAPFWLKVE